MVLDHSELVATADTAAPDGTKVVAVGAAIGGGVGAALAIDGGSVVGAALIGGIGAYGAGLAATGYVAWTLGTAVGETEIVRDNLEKLIEAIFPIDDGTLPKPVIHKDEPWENGGGFSVSFGDESFDIQFYVDAVGSEGVSMDSSFNAGVEYFSDPYQAAEAALQLDIIGTPDYWLNGCGAGAILP